MDSLVKHQIWSLLVAVKFVSVDMLNQFADQSWQLLLSTRFGALICQKLMHCTTL